MTNFAHDETWFGGFYELAMELGDRSDEMLLLALTAVWANPSLSGCYLRNDVEPDSQVRVPVTAALLDRSHLYGVATLPCGHEAPCGTFVIREDAGPDWLGFYLPMGALEGIYPIKGFPFEGASPESQVWRDGLDTWLWELGINVFASVPFRLALIGHEVSGEMSAAEIERDGVPEMRWAAILTPNGQALRYHPRSA